MWKISIYDAKKAPAFHQLPMPLLLLLSFLMDEPVPELLPLSLQSAPTVRVLPHQARQHHLSITLVHVSEAVRVVQIELAPGPKGLVLKPVGHQGLLHLALLLLLSVLENAG